MRLRPRKALLVTPFFVAVLLLGACSDDPLPTEEDSSHDDAEATEELNVDLSVSPDHVHILSRVTFTATVTDHHGDPVTDFDSLRVERRAADSEAWSGTELELDGESWVGAHTFTSSGDYRIRVAGMRPEDTETVVMYERPESLHAARAHADAGGYRVEFETFPGHVHEGDSATLRFWVSEEDAPVTGLDPEIHVVEGDGGESTHSATESGSGVYESEHTFSSAEEATVGLHFTGSGGSGSEAEFTIHIAHAHE